jgi:hypothetical protein
MRRAWDSWKPVIIAVVAVIAIGSLASAHPSLRGPRGPHETLVGPERRDRGLGRERRHRGHRSHGRDGRHRTLRPGHRAIEPSEDGGQKPDFSACEGMTGLDNAICRHEALLVVHPDSEGLQNALDHLRANKDQHDTPGETKGNPHDESGEDESGDDGSDDESDDGALGQSHGQSGVPHGNAGGNGNGHGHATATRPPPGRTSSTPRP